MLSSPGFQRFAARFPLTRPVARRHARDLFDLVAGFAYSQILAACIDTRLIEVLATGPLNTDTLAERTGLPREGAVTLLRAAASLGLVERLGADWTLGSRGAALLGNPGITQMVSHHRALYADLADPVALLKRGGGGGQLSDWWRYAESPGQGAAEEVGPYSALMAASQPMVAEQVLAVYEFRRHRSLLDIGGGEGAFVAAVAAAAPKLQLGIFDLPAVVNRAREGLAARSLARRVELFSGNFLDDPIPDGFDLISLIRVLHDHDDDVAIKLLRRIRGSLPIGGTLLIAEPMSATAGAEPAGDGYFGFYLLAMGSGRPRSQTEIRAMLSDAGFRLSRSVETPLPILTKVIVATV